MGSQFWLSGLFLLVASGGLNACSSVPQTGDETPAFPTPFPIIDAHVHTSFEGLHNNPSIHAPAKSETQFFDELKAAGVVGAVAHTVIGEEYSYKDLRAQNVIHCAGLSQKSNLRTVEEGIRSGKFACIKIYLGYVYKYATDPAYLPYYRLALRYDVPVVFHTGDTFIADGKIKYADPMGIDEIAVDFRKVRFVIAHCGNPWIQTAAEIAYKNENVFLDGSAFLVGDLKQLPEETIQKTFVEPMRWIFRYVNNPYKILFASDWPLTSIREYAQAFRRAIPPEYWQDVFYNNAKRVFKTLK